VCTLHTVIVEVGVREFRENLSDWLDRAASGDTVVVTERGRPKVQVTGTGYAVRREQLAREGVLRKAKESKRPIAFDGPDPEDSPATDAILRARGVLD
jgi:prevent-host-death family protein